MSYDIQLTDPKTEEAVTFDFTHDFKGRTYPLGGAKEAKLNVTYNYTPIFKRVLGEESIRRIYGMTGEESLPLLKEAMDALGDDTDDNRWKATEGNAKAALMNLWIFAQLRKDGIWQGD